MTKLATFVAFGALFALLAAPASAEDVKAGDLVISNAWARATPPGASVGAGYLTITNTGGEPDRLMGGTFSTGHVEVHEMSMNNDVMSMRPVSGGLQIDGGKSVTLAPSGYHLMIIGLKSPLKQGSKLDVTLDFQKGGKVSVPLEIGSIGAMGPSGAAPAPTGGGMAPMGGAMGHPAGQE